MANKNAQIPTTTFVPPFPAVAPLEQQETWLRTVAGFCNGAQAVKLNESIKSLRIGNVIFMSGSIEIEEGISYLSILPVVPRDEGFIQICDSTGGLRGLMFTAGSKSVSTAGITPGTYRVSGWYLATSKETL